MLIIVFQFHVIRRYIKEDERKELFQQAISFCIQSFRNQISSIRDCPIDKRDDKEHLSLLIDIFKAHQKAIKHLLQKENMFASLLVDGYKVYVEGKLQRIPDNLNVLDAAIKLCQCEVVLRKNNDKPGVEPVSESSFVNSLKMFPSLAHLTHSTSGPTVINLVVNTAKIDEATTSASTFVPTSSSTSITTFPPSTSTTATFSQNASSRPRGRPPGSKNALSKSLDWNLPKMNAAAMAAILGIYSNPSMPSQYTNPAQVSALLEEYYKLSAGLSSSSLLNTREVVNSPSSLSAQPPHTFNSTTTSTFPKYDMKSSIPSSTVLPNLTSTSTVISVGSGQLTITPSSYASSKVSKSSITRPSETSLMNVGEGVDFDIESIIPKSELLTNKIFSDMSAANKAKLSMQPPIISSMSIPKDLPKSLTITPAPAGYSGKPIPSNAPHVTVQPETKKKSKPHKRSATVPYGRMPNFAAKPPTPLFGDVFSGYQQLLLSQMNMMSRNIPNPLPNPTQFQPSSSKPKNQSSNKKETLPFPVGSKSMLSDVQISAMANTSSRPYQPTTYRANQSTNNAQQAHLSASSPHKFGTTPMTAHSPNKSPVLPPPIACQPSPAIHQVRYYIIF